MMSENKSWRKIDGSIGNRFRIFSIYTSCRSLWSLSCNWIK